MMTVRNNDFESWVGMAGRGAGGFMEKEQIVQNYRELKLSSKYV